MLLWVCPDHGVICRAGEEDKLLPQHWERRDCDAQPFLREVAEEA